MEEKYILRIDLSEVLRTPNL